MLVNCLFENAPTKLLQNTVPALFLDLAKYPEPILINVFSTLMRSKS